MYQTCRSIVPSVEMFGKSYDVVKHEQRIANLIGKVAADDCEPVSVVANVTALQTDLSNVTIRFA